MKKVVAFLEKYAEWVALGLGCVFLLYMVYSYVISPDDFKVKVGNEALLPGDVDPYINKNLVKRLEEALNAPAGADITKVPDFSGTFARVMGPNRDRMELAGGQPIRPLLPGEEFQPQNPQTPGIKIARLPVVPVPTIKTSNSGNSMVAPPPPPLPAEGEDAAAAPPPPQLDPQAELAAAIDKTWSTIEYTFDTKALAEEWKAVFFDPKTKKPLPGLPPAAMLTHFLQLEVEREEQTGPDQWGNKVTLQPLPLINQTGYPKGGYPKLGDRQGEEEYRTWAETHQLDIVEPAFYRVLKGDEWYIPSLGPSKEKDAAAQAIADQPFDPANPNVPFEKQTPAQRQAVYKYKQEQDRELQKQKAAERKAKSDAAASQRGAGSSERGGGGGGGRRSIGGYAPLPDMLAAGPQYDDGGRLIRPGSGPNRPGLSDRSGSGPTPGPRRDTPQRDPSRVTPSTAAPADSAPVYDPTTGQIQNAALTNPFDPSRMLDYKGNAVPITMWIHDDTAVPGKTYRYRARIKLKNPLYNTSALASDPKWEAQLAIASDFTPWKEVKVPSNVVYFFAAAKQAMTAGGPKQVASVTVDVFRREKGEWTYEKFTAAPGDGIGAPKNNLDYATGATLVDLRLDTREKDVRILVTDDVGNILNRSLEQDKADPFYKTLQDKVKSTTTAAPAVPQLINEVR